MFLRVVLAVRSPQRLGMNRRSVRLGIHAPVSVRPRVGGGWPWLREVRRRPQASMRRSPPSAPMAGSWPPAGLPSREPARICPSGRLFGGSLPTVGSQLTSERSTPVPSPDRDRSGGRLELIVGPGTGSRRVLPPSARLAPRRARGQTAVDRAIGVGPNASWVRARHVRGER